MKKIACVELQVRIMTAAAVGADVLVLRNTDTLWVEI